MGIIEDLGLKDEVEIEEVYSGCVNNDGEIINWYQYSELTSDELVLSVDKQIDS